MNALSVAQAWDVLEQIPDPEIPAISLTELGIVRDVAADGGALEVTVTPTYSGCPATEAIARSIEEALRAAGAAEVRVRQALSPAWTTDWLGPEARAKLAAYGIAPPRRGAEQPVAFAPRSAQRPREAPVACPRCASEDTERLSQFGATACKALYRCRVCREPFEYFKPL